MTQGETRFWQKVSKGPGCWEWIGAKNTRGYGNLRNAGRTRSAHRVGWELANGPVPPGLHVLHRCDNRACVNPAHLSLGTHDENMKDMARKGRAPKGTARTIHKLTEGIVEVIRKVYSPWHPEFGQRALAKFFRVSGPVIEHAIKGDTWRHVATPVVAGDQHHA